MEGKDWFTWWNELPYCFLGGDPRTQRKVQLALLSTHCGQLVANPRAPSPQDCRTLQRDA